MFELIHLLIWIVKKASASGGQPALRSPAMRSIQEWQAQRAAWLAQHGSPAVGPPPLPKLPSPAPVRPASVVKSVAPAEKVFESNPPIRAQLRATRWAIPVVLGELLSRPVSLRDSR